MATALDVITRALRKLKVYGAGEDVGASDAEDCLVSLNDMLFGWAINGIDLAHTTLALTDALDVPNDHLEAITLSLAERVADEFAAQFSPVDAAIADQGRAALRAYHFTIATIGIDHPMARPRGSTL
jgi:hypothetical protein